MKVFAVSDLHLSFSRPVDVQTLEHAQLYKPMDVFGMHWQNYVQRLWNNWTKLIGPDDWVLMPGDLSWGLDLDACQYDFDFLRHLPGRIVLIKGNHDYWWQGITRVRTALPPNVFALNHDCLEVGNRVVCGSRGWILPGSSDWKEHDQKLYNRECIRLAMSLTEAAKTGLPIVVMMHYMPFLKPEEPSRFVELMRHYGTTLCVYGHLHGEAGRQKLEGNHFGIEFVNASVDLLDFCPKLLWQE